MHTQDRFHTAFCAGFAKAEHGTSFLKQTANLGNQNK